MITTTNSNGQSVTSMPSLVTTELTTSDSNGVVYTVTQIIRNPTGSLNDGSASGGGGSSAFFNNTGAVVGVFVVVGIAGAAILLGIGFLFIRRRRRQKLDRDVAAAAAAANAAAQRTPFEDDEDASGAHSSFGTTASGPAMTQYGGYYASGSGGPEYDYEQAGGYDPYAAAAAGMGAVGGGAVASSRLSGGNSAAGGADPFAHPGGNEYDPYAPEQYPHQHQGPPPPAAAGEYYLDPNEYDYDNVGAAASGGAYPAAANAPYSDTPPTSSHHHQQGAPATAVYGGMHSNASEGSVGDIQDEEFNRRGALKVTNPSDE
jgi:LPXTG-motif cell wall-anchored protein